MTKHPFRFTFFLLTYLTLPLAATAQVVNIPDPNLRAAIAIELGKAANTPTTVNELATLTRLAERNANISNLTGLESATNLTTLDLDENNITDISPVIGLTNLTWLLLGSNNISDISVLAGLTNLTGLSLYNNNISDISAVTELTNLTKLWFGGNNISDLLPLVANTGLGHGDEVDVRGNPLSSLSIYTHIPILQGRGVTVEFDPPAPPAPFENVPFDVNNIPEPVPPPKKVRDFFDLDPFYQQWINIKGFPVLASEQVNPYALKESVWLIWQVIGNRWDLINAFARKKVHFVIMAHNEVLSDIPEFSPNHVDFLVYNIRGEGGTAVVGHPTPTTGEENVFGDTSTYRAYSVLIHELAHVVHRFGLTIVDPTFDNRLQRAYDAAMVNGLWQGTYAASNSWEYWAEGTHAWFYPQSVEGSFTGDTRQALKKYDPPLVSLLTEIYGDSNWSYTPPRERTHLPHLQGFNPQDAPTFQPPQELVETYKKFRNPSNDGDGKWVDLRPYDPSFLHSLHDPRVTGSHTMIAFINLTQADMLVYPVGGDGTARFWKRLPPPFSRVDNSAWTPTRVGGRYLIKDANGRDIALFQAVKETGRALITPTLNLITPGLSKVSGDNQSGISDTVLSNPFVIEVRNQNLTVLEGISVTFTVTAGNGTLSVTHTTTDANGRAESTLTLGGNLRINTVSVSAAGIDQPAIFNAVVEAAILSKVSGDNQSGISDTVLSNPFVIEVRNQNLTVLEGISVTFTVTAGNGTLSVTHTTTDANGRAESTLTLGGNLRINTVSVSAAGIDQPAIFNAVAETAVDIPDPNLRAVVLTALNKPKNDLITPSELATLTRLAERNANISNLTGLESATNLTTLDLDENNITDISPVVGLTNLTWLLLGSNNISDISVLAGLTNLTGLSLYNNNISDISTVTELTNLTKLWLGGNNISNLSPLVANTGLGEGDIIDVRRNPLSYTSIHTHIPTLQSRGVTVEFNTRKVERPLKISGDNQQGTVGAVLTNPFVVEVRDRNGTAFAGVPVTFAVTAGGGTLSVTHTPTDANGRAESTLTLGVNLGTNTVSVSAAGIDQPAIFNAVVEAAIDIPDPNLRAAVLTTLNKPKNDLITPSELATLTRLAERNANISNLTGLESATNLTTLNLDENNITDISPVVGLTNLTKLWFGANSISDISPLVANTGLGSGDTVDVRGNPLNYASIYIHIPELQSRGVTMEFDTRKVQRLLKISGDNQRGAPGAVLPQSFVVEVWDQNGEVFAGVPVRFTITEGDGALSITSTMTDEKGRAESTLTLGLKTAITTVEGTVEGISEPVTFNAGSHEFRLAVPVGISLIHVPLKVTAVDGVAKPITTIAALYDALGGAASVNYLITYDPQTQGWLSYFGVSDKDTAADKGLTDDTGIIAGMKTPVSLRLSGDPLGTAGSSTITLNPGLNLVGIPLRDSRIVRVSDLFALEGIGGNVAVVIVSDNGGFKAIAQAGDDGDLPVTGGQSFILTAQSAATVAISGEGWSNVSGTAAAPLVRNADLYSLQVGIQVTDTTPVLALRGAIVAPDHNHRWGILPSHLRPGSGTGFRVKVQNLSTPITDQQSTTGRAVSRERRSAFPTVTGAEEVDYRLTVVDIETGRAAKIGDILEISSQSTHPFVGVEPLGYTVTVEDVKRGWIQLPALVAYEIPKETELLANYPNPFNPETWIPYRLAEDAFVTLTIYDTAGRVVRTLDVGHRIASAYENRSKAIYWDGRNALGEEGASGVYFYHLSAGDYSATRRMVILK